MVNKTRIKKQNKKIQIITNYNNKMKMFVFPVVLMNILKKTVLKINKIKIFVLSAMKKAIS
jgi:hypothetical protein